MFVPWLEIAASSESDTQTINVTGVPVGLGKDGVFCWQPERDGSLVMCRYDRPGVSVHDVGSAVADRASVLGVEVLRPEWEGGNPAAQEVEEWVETMWQIRRGRWARNPHEEPLVVLLPNYENTASLADDGGYLFGNVHRLVGKLVRHGPRVNMFPVVTYAHVEGVRALTHPESGANNLYTPCSSVFALGYVGESPEEALAFLASEYLRTPQRGYSTTMLSPDQIRRGSWE